MSAPRPIVVSVAGAAEALGLSERQVWRYIRSGALPRVEIGGSTRVRWEDLERFCADRVTTAPPKPAVKRAER